MARRASTVVPVRLPASNWHGYLLDAGAVGKFLLGQVAVFAPDPQRVLAVEDRVNQFREQPLPSRKPLLASS